MMADERYVDVKTTVCGDGHQLQKYQQSKQSFIISLNT
jgi:hypothetical protein